MNFSEIGCASNSDCPSQRACINARCVDLCKQTDQCGLDQECQMENHQSVCIKGLYLYITICHIVLND